MNKRNVGVILLITVAVIVGIIVWGAKQPEESQVLTSPSQSGQQQADVVFYYGQECSHCEKVEKFIADNQIEQKVVFAKKEVWHNTVNNQEFQEKIKECSIDPEKAGVPFLFARGKCYIGEIEVEDFFKREAGIQ